MMSEEKRLYHLKRWTWLKQVAVVTVRVPFLGANAVRAAASSLQSFNSQAYIAHTRWARHDLCYERPPLC